MSMSSVTPTGTAAPASGLDALASDSGTHPPASGFDMLLAAHEDATSGCSTPHVSERDSNNGSPDSSGDATPPPAAKVDHTTDAETLAAQLAGQPAPTPAPIDPAPAPAGDPLDSAAVLEAAAAAASPAGSDPTDPTARTDTATDPTTAAADPPTPAPPDLTALLVAVTPTDTPAATAVAVEIPPLLSERPATPARASERDSSTPTLPPSPPPGPAPNDPTRTEHTRTAPTDTGSVGFAPVNGPASTSTPVAAGATETVAAMRVEMRDGVLHASIHADHESSAQLVRASLNELRDQLAAEGVRTGTLSVSDGALGSSGHDGDARQASGQQSRRGSADPNLATADEPAVPNPGGIPTTIDSDASSLLDVRV